MKKIITFLILASLLSCNKNNEKADGYGNFEATEVTISAEANGKIQYLKLEEGEILESNSQVGLIDTTQLYFNKQQLIASKSTVYSKSTNVLSQRKVLQEQLKTAQIEKKRILNMFAENAATKRQVDEIDGKVSVIQEQIKSVETQNAPIVNEVKSIDVQIEKINDQIQKSKIINPIKGTVLSKYAEPNEVTAFGKPIYKIADISEMTLRVYVSETQLSNIKIGQVVTVKIDSGKEMKSFQGAISWISSSAEFTPKIIQTKEERVNLVYAVKVKVKNDGSLKIGMPAEMWVK
ncbi:HlyD family efflux transporter periplasmic adaptor subunit [Flavobacterium franklandianum]|uniref:HlyD family efflux transporter periplasmic adaptor subunit n=1 Tax=Flavobacterium franklandianum TaxID=2594430 RepID=A0A553C849_9FLAO|nr:HlyD family efflux transporter periplasmic adaptor subunit [Flavobacterium franklandianum]TRX16689.1 HlyD family efflux transporter periplasmic adaptor subunit [Flavobacterium franklandianum]TRX24191.1 HlyD family efflux transporter periplasmic adaptor subunit [Flavobacterium franklandianum]